MSKFKKGDWVYWDIGGDREPFIATHDYNSANPGDSIWLKLWEPKQGEWCWFFTKDKKYKEHHLSPQLGRYGVMSYTYDFYDYIEPFLGELPTVFKEIK